MDENYWQLGVWRRIPVAMHWSVLLSCVWLYLFFWDLLATAIASVAFFALLLAHEFGHVAMLRRKKIAIESIELYGIHGKTSYGWASDTDEILIAWAGVGAQMMVMLAAIGLSYASLLVDSPLLLSLAQPVWFVFIKLNVLLMIVALLPIGPFDGHQAWRVTPWLKKSLRQRKHSKQRAKVLPGEKLSPEKRRELEAKSSKVTAELLEKLGKNNLGDKEKGS
jgi:Zn-dependent protease